jgi:hypothetical protein
MATEGAMSDTITVGTSDEHIREAIRRHALDEAEGPYRAEIAALYETFDAHNAAFFGGELRPVTITISPPQSARAVADAREHSGWGGYQEMRIRPSVVVGEHPTGAYADTPKPGWRMRPGRRGTEGHRRWLSDLVLHEMVHLLLNQRRDPRRNDHKGHGAPYTAECNRVSALLGLPGVKARRRKGEPRELPISPDWPFCVRPGGEHGAYYGDLWERVEVEREAPEEPATAGERMLAIWWHEDTPEGERVRFLRKAGLARVGGVEVIDEPPTEAASPLTERVTINAGKKVCRWRRPRERRASG